MGIIDYFIGKNKDEENKKGGEAIKELTMNDLMIFNNPEFGEIRMIEVDGKPYAVGVDVARILEYANSSKAILDHCKGDFLTWGVIDSLGRNQQTRVIQEGDIYRLIVKAADQSKNLRIKEKAEKFERWIFDEVLPSIRKHGMYANDELIMARALQIASKKLQVTEEKLQITEVRAEKLEKEVKRLYENHKRKGELTLTEAAQKLKVFSQKCKPHTKFISFVVREIDFGGVNLTSNNNLDQIGIDNEEIHVISSKIEANGDTIGQTLLKPKGLEKLKNKIEELRKNSPIKYAKYMGNGVIVRGSKIRIKNMDFIVLFDDFQPEQVSFDDFI